MAQNIGIQGMLDESGWLRGLAASLIGDAQAEDLVQDTWLAALRQPPRAAGESRPWLARVVRNLARNSRRDRSRRAAREEFAHEERAHPSPDALAQQAEAQRLLAAAVTRLSEPLRDAIVLRYFQGLDSSAAAARLGVPASTVRTRLQRALEELRGDLDRRCEGGRKAWGLLLVPLLREASPVAVALGSWPIWIACTGAACAVAVVGASSLTPELVVADSAPQELVAAADVLTPESSPLSPNSRADAERVVAATPAPAVSAAPVAGEVSGILRVDGRPPEWPIRLSLLPPARHLRPAVEATRIERTPLPELVVAPEQRGAFSFEGLSTAWSGRLRVDGYRFADGESSIVLDAPASGLVLDLISGPEIVGRIVGRGGLPLGDLEGVYELRTGEEGAESHEYLIEAFVCRKDGAFRIPILTRTDWGTVTILVQAEGQGYLRHESSRFAVATGIDLGELVLEPLRPLEFTVHDADGAPIEGAFAIVDESMYPNRMKRRPLTGADGSGVLDVVPDRAVKVRFGAIAHRDRVMAVEPGSRVEVVLEPLAVLYVRYGKSTARLRLSADRSAFVWDDSSWDEAVFQGGTPPCRKSIPATPGQRFEYEFHAGERLQLIGLRPGLAITVEALDAEGTSLGARVVTVEAGRNAAIEL